MEDLFKKFLYTGVGLMAMTAEKIQNSVDKLISEGKLSMEEGKKVLEKLVEEGKLSADEGKKVIDELVEKGKISAEEGKKTVEEFFKNAKTKRNEIDTQVKSIVERVLSSFDYATEKELNDLKKRVAAVESKMKAAAKPAAKGPGRPSKKPPEGSKATTE
jgi:polyhydroxyalkanoate synthesis regulator phasin